MPEGDTIFRTATRLRPLLQGRAIVAARARWPDFPADSLVDRVVTSVEARGKHLLIHTDDSRTIHSHLGMHGAWHVYRPGESWQKSERQAALVIETAEDVCVCFNPKLLEMLTATRLRRHPHLCRLGPDVLADGLDEDENLGRSPRQTRFGLDGARLWVYGRSGKACFTCGQRIRLSRQGDLGRTTFWCPSCQG